MANTSKHYWGGCFWKGRISKEDDEEGVRAYLMPSMSLAKAAVDKNKPELLLYSMKVRPGKRVDACLAAGRGVGNRQTCTIHPTYLGCLCAQVDYSMEVAGSSATDSGGACRPFYPSAGSGWGDPIHDEPVAWESFWADGSPWLARDSVACVRFTLHIPA